MSTGPVTAYLREVTGDYSVEVLFRSSDKGGWVREDGHAALPAHHAPSSWVRDDRGASVALLVAESALALLAASQAVDTRLGMLLLQSSRHLALMRSRVAEQQQTLSAARLDVDGLRQSAPAVAVNRLEETLRLALNQVVDPGRSDQPL